MNVVEVEGLVRKYGSFTAVDGVSFDVRAGEVFGFLGPNGAGKSTTVLMLTTLLPPTAGRARVAGHDIAREGAMAKLYSSQVAERVTSLCLELFGGYGYTKEYPAEKFYRDAKIGTIYEGTSNMQLQTIAKAVLK